MSSAARAAVQSVEIVEERYRLLQGIAGLVIIEETIVSIGYTDLVCQYQVTATCCWYTGEPLEVSVCPVPSPPPVGDRRGFWWAWTN